MHKKVSYIKKISLLITIVFFCFLFSQIFAEETEEVIHITVFPHIFINNYFYGFGAETLPWLWTKENIEAGVNEEDIKLNLQRIEEMRLPITRIFAPWETWNPSLDYKTFTWESDEMRSLYKTLDFYQKMGTKVILVTVDWLKTSPWEKVEPSAGAVAKLLEYLINEKGYSCIRYWTLTNEPELTYSWLKKMPFKNYIRIHQLVKAQLKKRKLPVKIIVSDDAESRVWFERSVRSLYKIADVFSSHKYYHPKEINLASGFFEKRLGIIKKATLAKRDIPFFLCEFGFRGSDFGPCTNSLMENYEYGLYVAKLCIEVLNSGIDAASLWCLYQVRLIDEVNSEGCKVMRIGLWAYKDQDWRLFPTFYLYRLFTRYIESGSKVVKLKVSPDGKVDVACVQNKDSYALFIFNLTEKEQPFLIQGIKLKPNFRKYIYTYSNYPPIRENMPIEKQGSVANDYIKDLIPPKSVVLYSDL